METQERVLQLTGAMLGFIVSEALHGDRRQGLLIGHRYESRRTRLTDDKNETRHVQHLVKITGFVPLEVSQEFINHNSENFRVSELLQRSKYSSEMASTIVEECVVGWFRGRHGCQYTSPSLYDRLIHERLTASLCANERRKEDVKLVFLSIQRSPQHHAALLSHVVLARLLPSRADCASHVQPQVLRLEVLNLCSTAQVQAGYSAGNMCRENSSKPMWLDSALSSILNGSSAVTLRGPLEKKLRASVEELQHDSDAQLRRVAAVLATESSALAALRHEIDELRRLAREANHKPENNSLMIQDEDKGPSSPDLFNTKFVTHSAKIGDSDFSSDATSTSSSDSKSNS